VDELRASQNLRVAGLGHDRTATSTSGDDQEQAETEEVHGGPNVSKLNHDHRDQTQQCNCDKAISYLIQNLKAQWPLVPA
jgi:hypothetical protein